MAIRNIPTGKEVEKSLRRRCREVTLFDERLAQLIDDMADTLHDAGGVGLAACQVGIFRRVAVVDVGDGIIELVNPVVIESSGEQDGPEGCLSFPGEFGMVKRPMNVIIKAQDRNGKKITVSGEGLSARAFCHEIDHLNGIVCTMKMYKHLTQKEMEKIMSKKL